MNTYVGAIHWSSGGAGSFALFSTVLPYTRETPTTKEIISVQASNEISLSPGQPVKLEPIVDPMSGVKAEPKTIVKQECERSDAASTGIGRGESTDLDADIKLKRVQLAVEAHVRIHFGLRHVDGAAVRVAVQPRYETAFELAAKSAVTDATKRALCRLGLFLVYEQGVSKPRVAIEIM